MDDPKDSAWYMGESKQAIQPFAIFSTQFCLILPAQPIHQGYDSVEKGYSAMTPTDHTGE